MEAPHVEGLTTHSGPESCVGAGNRDCEALTGESAGWVFSREKHAPRKRVLRGADVLGEDGRQHRARRQREARQDLARSETPSTHGNTSHGNREIPRSSVASWITDRAGNPEGVRR
jgi:RNA-directed DNA polymerase